MLTCWWQSQGKSLGDYCGTRPGWTPPPHSQGLNLSLYGGSIGCWGKQPVSSPGIPFSGVPCQRELPCLSLWLLPRDSLHSVTDWCWGLGEFKRPASLPQFRKTLQGQSNSSAPPPPQGSAEAFVTTANHSSVSLFVHFRFLYLTYETQKKLPRMPLFLSVLSLLWKKIGEGSN